MANQEWEDFDIDETKTGLDSVNLDDDDGIKLDPINNDDDDEPDDKLAPDSTDDPEGEPDSTGDTSLLSGVEMYLAQFGIEGGMINLADNTSKNFNELTAEEQALVLQQLHDQQAVSVEDKYGLAEDEIAFLNYARQNNLDVQSAIEQMAQERVNTILAMQESTGTDYTKMGDDAVYSLFLKKSNPDATPEQIESDLALAKSMSNFTKVTENIRGQFVADQQNEVNRLNAARIQENQQLIEEQRTQVVNAVLPIKEVAGILINDTVKNSVLSRVLEVDQDGDSLFLSEVFSDPEKLFKAAFWFYYGESVLAEKDKFWKQEKSGAYARGRQDAIKGAPSAPMSFRSNKDGNKPQPGNDNYPSLDDLHD